jgi:hypothetical protein
METFWLHGHEKLPDKTRSSPIHLDEILESVYEPEFLQII